MKNPLLSTWEIFAGTSFTSESAKTESRRLNQCWITSRSSALALAELRLDVLSYVIRWRDRNPSSQSRLGFPSMNGVSILDVLTNSWTISFTSSDMSCGKVIFFINWIVLCCLICRHLPTHNSIVGIYHVQTVAEVNMATTFLHLVGSHHSVNKRKHVGY